MADDGLLPPLAKFALLVGPTAVLSGVISSYWPFSAWSVPRLPSFFTPVSRREDAIPTRDSLAK